MPDALIRIHGYPISTWTRTLRMTCAEKGLTYELVPVRYGSEEHGALHPGPAFLVGDALSLADLYLAPQLANCREKAPELSPRCRG